MIEPHHPFDDVKRLVLSELEKGHTVMVLLPNPRLVQQFKLWTGLREPTGYVCPELREPSVYVRSSTDEYIYMWLPIDTMILVGQNHPDWNTPGEKANLDHLRYHQDWNTSESNLILMSPNLWTYNTAVYDTGNHRWDKELRFMSNFVIGWHLPVVDDAAHSPRVTTRQLRAFLWRCLQCGHYDAFFFKWMIQVDSEYYVF